MLLILWMVNTCTLLLLNLEPKCINLLDSLKRLVFRWLYHDDMNKKINTHHKYHLKKSWRNKSIPDEFMITFCPKFIDLFSISFGNSLETLHNRRCEFIISHLHYQSSSPIDLPIYIYFWNIILSLILLYEQTLNSISTEVLHLHTITIHITLNCIFWVIYITALS